MKQNNLEIALEKGEDSIDDYLSDVEVKDFIRDLKEITGKSADKGAIREAIKFLQTKL